MKIIYILKDIIMKKISYYDIEEWSYDMYQNMFTFSTKINDKRNVYSIHVYENESGKNISEQLKDIVSDHLKHLKNIVEKI